MNSTFFSEQGAKLLLLILFALFPLQGNAAEAAGYTSSPTRSEIASADGIVLNELTERLRAFLDNIYAAELWLAGQPELQQYLRAPRSLHLREATQERLQSLLDSSDNRYGVRHLLLLPEQGEAMALAQNRRFRLSPQEIYAWQDAIQFDRYTGKYNHGPFSTMAGERYVLFSQALYQDGKTRGLAVIAVELGVLSDMLDNLVQYGDERSLYVINAHGDSILNIGAHPLPADSRLLPAVQTMLRDQNGTVPLRTHTYTLVCSYASLPESEWVVVVGSPRVQPYSIMRALRSYKGTLIAGLALGLVLLGLAWKWRTSTIGVGRKDQKESSHSSPQQVQAVLEKAPLGVLITWENKVLWANPKAEELLTRKEEELCELSFVSGDDADALYSTLNRHGSIHDFAVKLYAASDQIRDMRLSARTTEFEGQRAYLVWLIDISDLKHMEKALLEAHVTAREASRAKNEFLARMSHEIRTPMNAILGMGYLCLQTKLDVRQREYLTKIQEAAQMLLGVINDILDFSKADEEAMVLEQASFHLDALLESVGSPLAPRIEKKGIHYHVDIDPLMPNRLVGDALRLSQILQVLLSNALKFTDEGTITLHVEAISEENNQIQVRFSVRDSGIGMSPDTLDKLFQPFTQADISSTRRYGGAGLGLAISKSLVELMGGRIWAESALSKGSVFHFQIPLARETRGPVALPGSMRDFSDMELLVVDDSISAVVAMGEQASRLGFHVSSASGGMEALGIMEKAATEGRRFDFLLLDWNMEDLNGVETAHLIQSAFPPDEMPYIILVSNSNAEIPQDILDENAIRARLTKPISADTLEKTVRALLEASTALSAATKQTVSQSISATTVPSPASAPSRSGIQGARVLLVEDNEINQEIALALLEAEGLQVDIADNGQEALDKINAQPPFSYQIVFMDIQMPVMDGLDAARQIRALGLSPADLPIVAMTAHARDDDRQDSLDAGMNDHITKPIDPNMLHTTLLKWVDSHRIAANTSAMPETLRDDPTGALKAGAYYTPSGLAVPLENGGLPGFSQAVGLESVGGNQVLYTKLLRKFRESCGLSVQEIQQAITVGDNELAIRTAHTVKGVSASLGMIALSQVAATTEKHLKEHQDGLHEDLTLTSLLDKFKHELTHALNEVSKYLGDHGGKGNEAGVQNLNAVSVSPQSAHLVIDILRELKENLESDWGRVMAAQDSLNNLLGQTSSYALLTPLNTAVENFDIPQARNAAKKVEEAMSMVTFSQNQG